jgi:hypothetical protein
LFLSLLLIPVSVVRIPHFRMLPADPNHLIS